MSELAIFGTQRRHRGCFLIVRRSAVDDEVASEGLNGHASLLAGK